jgi:hypothetical protein
VADVRSAAEVASQIRRLGYEPVWKDWDEGLGGSPEEMETVRLQSA